MLLILAFLSVSEKKDSIRVIITIVNISAFPVSKLFSFARFIDSMVSYLIACILVYVCIETSLSLTTLLTII